MAPALLPIALGLAAAGALGYALLKKKRPTPPGAPPAPGARPGMPPELRAAYQELLARGQDPDAMDRVAAQLDAYGYNDEAEQLRAKAKELRARPAYTPPLAGPPPIPPGYTPPAYVPPTYVPPLPAPPLVSPVPVAAGTQALVKATPGLNTRTGPGVSYPLVVPNDAYLGTTVTVLAFNAGPPDAQATLGWTKIRTPGGAEGYASTSGLDLPSAAPGFLPALFGPSPTPAAAQTATVTGTPGVNVRTSPSASAPTVTPNDAFKGTKVRVLNWNAAPPDSAAPQGWANVVTPGGATGYATKAAMVLDAPAPVAAGELPAAHIGADGRPKMARCVAPSGCKIRREPSPSSRHDGIVPSGAVVYVHDTLRLPKSDTRSPGKGGWSRVDYAGRRGWVPSEWLI